MTTLSNPPKIWRHLFIIIYDLLIVSSLLIVLTNIAMIFNDHKVIPNNNIIFKVALFFTVFYYYHYSWRYYQQTIGMRAWRVKIISQHNQPISWYQSLLRIISGICSFVFCYWGYLWQFVSNTRSTIPDLVSKTSLIEIKSFHAK